MKVLPEEKIGQYLAEGDRRGLLPIYYLELTTGLRRGELLALLWTDLDIESKTISVTKQVNRINGELVVSRPKTQNSVRTLAIPQQAVDLLIEEHNKHPSNPYMFPSPKTGTMYDPDSFRHTHDKILKSIGAEHIRFHDLRHTLVYNAIWDRLQENWNDRPIVRENNGMLEKAMQYAMECHKGAVRSSKKRNRPPLYSPSH